MDPRKKITQLMGVAAVAQMLALMLFESTWSVIIPPVLASLPIALLTRRSPDIVQKISPKLRQYYLFAAVLGCAAIGWFVLSGNDLRFDLQLGRAVLAAAAILSLASTFGVQAATMRDGGHGSAN